MQNRTFLWVFVLLLSLSVVYALSFSWVARNFEKQAHTMAADSVDVLGLQGEARDSMITELERKILRDSSEAKVYPVFGHTYSHLKQKQLNLGLDLKGGMSVTLEVSIPDLIIALSDNNENPAFREAVAKAKTAQRNSTDDFITLFRREWDQVSNGTELWRIFVGPETKDKFPQRASDDEIIDVLRKEAEDAINNTENIIRKRIDQFGVAQANVQKQSLSGRILVELPGIDDRERVRKNLKSTANLEFWDTYFNTEVIGVLSQVNDAAGRKMAPQFFLEAAAQAEVDSLAAAIDANAEYTQAVKDSLKTELTKNTGIKADSLLTVEEQRKKNPLFAVLDVRVQSGSPMVGMTRVSDTSAVNRILALPEVKTVVPPTLRLLWGAKTDGGVAVLYAIKDNSQRGVAELDGKSITNARQDFDPISGDVVVEMSMDAEVGTPAWREMTRKNAADNRRAIAIVMDNLVYSAPMVNSEIPNGRSQITMGSGSEREKAIQEAGDLAGLLKAGSLPAPARIIDEVTVGPSLGERNINAGIFSFIAAFIVILLYMIFYYAWAGFAANVALIANLFFLIGALISFEGALTLPGIAGIVLTMGMAVDANVLIYERVKEELRMGKPVSVSLKDGFLKAVSAIIDGNATTLITGFVLLTIGSGPIKGFATTLIIGIFTTLFSSLLISRLILYRRLDRKKPITFYSKITENWFTKMNYDFVGKRRMFYVISIVLIGAGLVSMFTRGFNMGVDFAGGTSYKVAFAQEVNVDAVRDGLEKSLVEPNGNKAAITVQSIGTSGKEFKITTNYLINSEEVNVDEQVSAGINSGLTNLSVPYEVISSYKVDATMSDDFRKEAFWSTIIGLLLVGIYIVIRFRKVDFAIGASVALIHDALMVVAAFTLLNGIMPFTLEVNQNFVGAILTVIGYSINDTVVIFDRIREYFKTRRNPEIKQTINDALNSTMGRSINTSMTVLLTLLVMFIFGSDDIKGFCFAMIIGVVSGVYSTLFIATPIVMDMRKLFGSKEASADAAETKVATA
jgi:SecD/SecF fusion protein